MKSKQVAKSSAASKSGRRQGKSTINGWNRRLRQKQKDWNSDTSSLRRTLSASQIIMALAALGFILYVTRSIVLPLVIAFLLYNLVVPILDGMEKRFRMPRFVACSVVFVGVFTIPLVIAMPFSSVVTKVVEDAHLYQERILDLASFIETKTQALGIDWNENVWVSALKEVPFTTYISGMASWLVDAIVYTGLIMIFFLFILGSRRSSGQRSAIFNEIHEKTTRYILIKSFISLVTAISVGLILRFLGVEFALLLALFTFILNFIPNLGPIFSTFLPLPVALLDFRGLEWFLAVLLLPAAVQMLFGNLIEPKLQGDRLSLHPITVLVALLVWGLIWGPAGMFVAVPVTTIIKIFIDLSPRSRWVGQLMEGRISDVWRNQSFTPELQ
jgi:AI-2 transport protein TqsA